MNNKRMYGDDVLKGVRDLWANYKHSTGATQKQAALELGFSSSAFGQYIRGEIPLNTDFLVRFAALTGRKPGSLHPSLGQVAQPTLIQLHLPVNGTLSGGEPSERRALVTGAENLNKDHFCVEVDVPGTGLPVGSLLIIDPTNAPSDGDIVVLERSDRFVYGQLSYSDMTDSWYLDAMVGSGVEREPVREGEKPVRVSGTQIPRRTKTRQFTG